MLALKHIALGCGLLLVVGSCQQQAADTSREPVLEVEGKFLYHDDLDKIIPEGTSREDSTNLADAYIRKWITDVLLYENAKRNIANEDVVEDLVEEYRKSLTIHYYQQRLVAQRLAEPTDEEVAAFYEKHTEQFLLAENMLRGVYLKVPLASPKVDRVRGYMRKINEKSIQQIEQYSIQHAVSYDYFVDKWLYLNDVLKKMPSAIPDQGAFLSNTKFYETRDSVYTYMLNITDYQLAGSPAPLEFVQEKVRTILYNQRKIEYIKNFETELYEDAQKDGDITYFGVK